MPLIFISPVQSGWFAFTAGRWSGQCKRILIATYAGWTALCHITR